MIVNMKVFMILYHIKNDFMHNIKMILFAYIWQLLYHPFYPHIMNVDNDGEEMDTIGFSNKEWCR